MNLPMSFASRTLCAALLAASCAQDASTSEEAVSRDALKKHEPTQRKTLDGALPLVIGHRGLPGLYPEETKIAYDAAAEAGADALEEDLHLSKDCVLIARHNPWLSDNTTIKKVAASTPEVAARQRSVPGRLVPVRYDVAKYGGPDSYLSDLTDPSNPKSVLESLVVDGEDHTGDWSISDFTLAEIKQWIRGTTYDDASERPTALNGEYPPLTFQEILDIAKSHPTQNGQPLSVYPEAKNPYWNNQQAKANGCGSGDHPFEDAILKVIADNDLNRPDAPIFVQSFDPDSLKYLRAAGLKAKVVQLVDGNAVDYASGDVVYRTDDAYNFVDGRPYSWTLAGDPRYFNDMLTPDGLAEIATYADGIGPWKPQLMAWQISPFPETAPDGSPFKGSMADVNKITPKHVIEDAHAAGLFVHSYTFRNETRYLPGAYHGDPQAEYFDFFAAGVDGVFTDFANTGHEARRAFFRRAGHRQEGSSPQ